MSSSWPSREATRCTPPGFTTCARTPTRRCRSVASIERSTRVASPDERARLWPKAVETYRGYRDYQQRTDREIALVILEPRA
jgi:hypothetical protein